MLITQATSFASRTYLDWMTLMVKKTTVPFAKFFKGLVVARQLQVNYAVAKRLAGTGEYKHVTAAELFSKINEETL